MDSPDLPAETYARVLSDLAMVNRLTLASLPTIEFLRRAVGARKHFSLLDVGFGQGDMLRTIARWAKRQGVTTDLVGIDLNPGSEVNARAATPPDMSIRYRTGDYKALAGEGFDFVASSIVTHHMSHAELVEFLRFMEGEAVVGWLVNDLHRRYFPYYGFPVLAVLMGWHRIVRQDGQLSIARSFRRDDWNELLDEAGIDRDTVRIARRFPFRLCVERLR